MIFRKVALERLSSPEQLDQLMQVTDPRGWISLLALGLVLSSAVVWGVTGSIPTEAQGEGILLRRGGVSDLVATGQGQIEEVLVQVGDVVETGDVVATVRQDELLRQIEEARQRLEDALEERQALARYAAEQRRLRSQNLVQQRANLRRSIEALERDVEILQERAAAEEQLLADGLITKQTLLATESDLNAKRDELATQRLELDGLSLTRLEKEQELEQRIESQEAEVRDRRLELRDLEATLEENANVVSPYTGRVLEIVVDRGDVVSPGTPVLSMEVVAEELMAVLFVPASDGKQVQPGMEVRVSPSTVKREEYGYILGEVVWVAEYPSTTRGMTRLLANEDLVSRLMALGPPIQVDVALSRDPATPTGYEWSSSVGPDVTITSGTLASGSVIVREQPPINLVIPQIRKQLGI